MYYGIKISLLDFSQHQPANGKNTAKHALLFLKTGCMKPKGMFTQLFFKGGIVCGFCTVLKKSARKPRLKARSHGFRAEKLCGNRVQFCIKTNFAVS